MGVGSAVAVITTTVDVHDAFCCTASTAVHVNDVVPTGNSDPDAGEQVVEIGVTPPLTVGVSVTEMDLPSGEVNTGEGHEIVRAGADTLPDTSVDGDPVVPALS